MKWLWIRHGETEDNAFRRYMGHRDTPLNAKGRLQAERLRRVLSGMNFERIFISDLSRARETAAIALPGYLACRMEVSASLRECSFGQWEGRTYPEIEGRDPERLRNWLSDPFRHAPPEGETLGDLDRRLSAWFRKAMNELADAGAVAVFTHAGPIRWFLAKTVYQDFGRFWEPRLPHGGGVLVERREGLWRVIDRICPDMAEAGEGSAG